jgi:hypothetical protein
MTAGQALLGLVGGVVGAGLLRLFDVLREGERDKAELLAAIRVLRDELRRNINQMQVAIAAADRGATIGSVEPLSDGAYRRVELVLARGLPAPLRAELARLYVLAPTIWSFVTSDALKGQTPDAQKSAGPLITHVKGDFVRIDAALGDYMRRATRGRELEMGPVDIGGWQVKDPKTGLTPSDVAQAERDSRGPVEG